MTVMAFGKNFKTKLTFQTFHLQDDQFGQLALTFGKCPERRSGPVHGWK